MLETSTVSGSGATYLNLQTEHHSRYMTKAGNRLWELINCRHGNTNPKTTSAALSEYQNYLPYSTTAYSFRSRLSKANITTTGTIVFQNTNTANNFDIEKVRHSSF
jgi:hypothetical protein